MDQPGFCNYPIRGLPWTTVRDVGYSMSLQESEFFGGHMLLMELEALEETEIMFSAPQPVVFTVVMVEGFFRFFQEEKLLSYAMGGSYYMTYNPSITARLKASTGKHVILVFALDRESLGLAERTYPPMEILMECIRQRSPHTVRLPVCRMTREVIDLWSCIRKLSSNIHIRSSDISSVVSRLIRIYQLQLKQGNVVKEQLSMEIANALIMYVDAHYTSDRDVRKAEIARRIGEPVSIRRLLSSCFRQVPAQAYQGYENGDGCPAACGYRYVRKDNHSECGLFPRIKLLQTFLDLFWAFTC